MKIEKIDWEQRCCTAEGFHFTWSKPRFDAIKERTILTLRARSVKETEAPECGSFRRDISFPKGEYSDDRLQFRIVSEIKRSLRSFSRSDKTDDTLEDYLSAHGRWERIRVFFGWSQNTAQSYRNTLNHVFHSVLQLSYRNIQTCDIDQAINAHRAKWQEATIRKYLSVINRVFVYLGYVSPGLENPVRFNGRKIREARADQKRRNALMRVSQRSLYNNQARKLLFAFLADIKNGRLEGVPAIMMLETGRRPKESGATALGMHSFPLGEHFLSAEVFGTDTKGNIDCTRKNGRANRLIPDSPIVRVVFDYVYQMAERDFCSVPSVDWREIPFGYQISRRNGKIVKVTAFSPKDISAYIKQTLVENDINLVVFVDIPEDDTNDNRRAYVLRYTAETCLAVFLKPELLQYMFGHKRVFNPKNVEAHADDPEYYFSPQVQREIYDAMEARDFAVYGENIIEEIKAFLYSD